MSEAVLAALITGSMSLAGVVFTCYATAKKGQAALQLAQAVTDTRIQELTREVREHNGFARRMPVVENQIETLQQTIRELKEYHR